MRNSLAVDPNTGKACCHSQCGRGWDMLGFEQQLTGADFRTARYEVFRIVGRTTSVNGKGHSQSKTASQWRSVATYTYTDESNQPLFRVIRRERGEGDAREKRFHQERFDGGRWVKGLGNVRRVPYRLAEVIQADEVFLVEGEKNCETLRGWGLVASTCPMG